ncbi:hypothetical protein MNBD_GAMMA02-101 [hydrothermal vent metagenome]|uniref:Uncharacterized protein n=1 Tax=hydrothermal vent metagenome TaxID=652676 RepID=A0A3B0WPG9_9ZZZZ
MDADHPMDIEQIEQHQSRSLSENRKSITEKLDLCHFPLFIVK